MRRSRRLPASAARGRAAGNRSAGAARRADLPRGSTCRSCRAARAPACPAAPCRSVTASWCRSRASARSSKSTPYARTATVQPGVRNLSISEAAAPYGLYYAPDPSSQIACTIGGNVSENSGGVHCLKYGLTVHNVMRVRAVTMEGEIVEFGSLAPGRARARPAGGADRQRRHVRDRHRSHRQADPEAANGAGHHGQFRRRRERRRRGRRRSSRRASSRPGWK